MPTVSRILFLSVLTFLVVHELDAVRQQEWRFFFAPVPVSDDTAYRVFTTLHVPLFVLVLWFLESPLLQVGVAGFALLHGILHFLLRTHPLLAFESWFSWLWIVGAAALAALQLAFVL